uniref:Uncharacterized protein n=1 Tax=Anguilla anguilla TaxID=7936 RepID=A0A0E9SEX2_ANGAN
MSHIPDPTS